MLKPLTTEEFAEWFAALDDPAAEDVATAIEVVERLGPAQAAPGSRASLLWYEHAAVSGAFAPYSFAWDLEAWGTFQDYARQILKKFESARFISRLSSLGVRQATEVLRLTQEIRRAADPRLRWALELADRPPSVSSSVRADPCAELRRLYLATLEAAGFKVEDVPAHSLSLRELVRRSEAWSFRLLYGVDSKREVALFVLGERLDRSYYGDSVRKAERLWHQFLDGSLESVESVPLR
ncbi:MAG TPA: hypothetical protein VG937_09920 [Polyangiaceae bacterium]|nr:hypothetical protein [Polyangiaceae bacterium]